MPLRSARPVLGLLIVAAAAHVALLWFTCDDAYIAFRYARNLADGHGPVFNPGERVEGYTSPLWVLVNAAFCRVGLPPEVWAARASAAAALASFAVVLAWLLHTRRDPVLFGVLTAACAGWAAWSTGGLETGLFTALVTLAFVTTVSWLERAERDAAAGAFPRAAVGSATLLGLAGWTRPEGALLIGLFAVGVALRVARGRVPVRAAAVWLAVALAPFAFHVAWRLSYYGDVVPNTFRVKARGVSLLPNGLEYVAYGIFRLHLYLLALPFAAWLFRGRPRTPGGGALLGLAAVVVVPYGAYVALMGGDFMDLFRFLVPVLPIAFLATGEVAGALGSGRSFVAGTAAWLAAYTGLNLFTSVDARGIHYRHGLDSIGTLDRYVEEWSAVGRLLAAVSQPSDTLAVTAAGCIPYHSGLYTIDQLGLAAPDLDEYFARDVSRPGHGLQLRGEALLAKRPHFLLGSAPVTPADEVQLALYIEPGWEAAFEKAYRTVSPVLPGPGGRRVTFAVREDVAGRTPPADR